MIYDAAKKIFGEPYEFEKAYHVDYNPDQRSGNRTLRILFRTEEEEEEEEDAPPPKLRTLDKVFVSYFYEKNNIDGWVDIEEGVGVDNLKSWPEPQNDEENSVSNEFNENFSYRTMSVEDTYQNYKIFRNNKILAAWPKITKEMLDSPDLLASRDPFFEYVILKAMFLSLIMSVEIDEDNVVYTIPETMDSYGVIDGKELDTFWKKLNGITS